MAGTTLPELLHFRISHYSEKVRWALDFKRVPHRRRALVPGFHLPVVRWLTGQNALPVLRLDGALLHDSTGIIAALERRQPQPPLYPADPGRRARALELEDWFDETVAPALRRLFWSAYVGDAALCARMATDGFGTGTRLAWRAAWPVMRPLFSRNMGLDAATMDAARRDLAGFFDRLERGIGASGYLAGDAFSVADLTAAAVMTAIIRPREFSYPLPEPWPAPLVELRESVAGRDGFRWVLDTYARHRGPSAEVA